MNTILLEAFTDELIKQAENPSVTSTGQFRGRGAESLNKTKYLGTSGKKLVSKAKDAGTSPIEYSKGKQIKALYNKIPAERPKDDEDVIGSYSKKNPKSGVSRDWKEILRSNKANNKMYGTRGYPDSSYILDTNRRQNKLRNLYKKVKGINAEAKARAAAKAKERVESSARKGSADPGSFKSRKDQLAHQAAFKRLRASK